jgi:geranylgeranyl reductase family protein
VTRVVVVGGGPAGAAAATTAARRGADVTVIDRWVFPRDKTCGDGLTTGALRLLEALGLEPGSVASWVPVRETVVVSPSGRRVPLPLPATGLYAAVARRAELDTAVLDLARKAGADIIEGDAVVSVATHGECEVAVGLHSGRVVAADYVIAADGMYSTVRKLVAPAAAPYLGEMHAFRQYFTGYHDERLWVLFEPDLLPGYAWVFPLGDGRANVGFGIHRRDGESVQSMKDWWPRLLARPSLQAALGDAVPESPHRAWPIPAALDRAMLTHGRVLFAGDAAAATDPMTGEGIGQALLMGVLAADAVMSCSFDAAAARTRYESAVARQLLRDHTFARALLRLLRTHAGARGAIRVAGLTPWTRRNFARWLFEDYPRALILTPSRWQRGAMTGIGAYVDNAS